MAVSVLTPDKAARLYGRSRRIVCAVSDLTLVLDVVERLRDAGDPGIETLDVEGDEEFLRSSKDFTRLCNIIRNTRKLIKNLEKEERSIRDEAESLLIRTLEKKIGRDEECEDHPDAEELANFDGCAVCGKKSGKRHKASCKFGGRVN